MSETHGKEPNRTRAGQATAEGPPNQSAPLVPADTNAGKPTTQAEASQDNPKLLTWLVIILDLVFVFFPFFIYAFVLAYQNRLHTIFTLSEWAFASTLLFGQAMIKFLLGLLSGRPPKHPLKLVFVTALIAMFGFVPSFVVLIFVLLNSTGATNPAAADAMFPHGWIVAQLIMFLLSVTAYMYFAGAGEYWRHVNENSHRSESSTS